jgi:hypothetical protein
MKTWRVEWKIDVDARSPRAAAVKAWNIVRRIGTTATFFDVWSSRRHHDVDLVHGHPLGPWQTIEDRNVRHVWGPCDCSKRTVADVDPTFYAESGTPVCPHCDQDLPYVRTEVRL